METLAVSTKPVIERIFSNDELVILRRNSTKAVQTSDLKYLNYDKMEGNSNQALILSQKIKSVNSNIDSFTTSTIVSKTLQIRAGDLSDWKFGPGSKAGGAARSRGRGTGFFPVAEGFSPTSINRRPGTVRPNPRIVPKLKENPVNRNNPNEGTCRSSKHQHPSMDTMANSLSPEYSEFQSKYYPESSPKRFDTNKCSAEKFEKLARDTSANDVKYDRVSIDEARAVVQAEVQNVVIEPTRANTLEARHLDLDYKVKGPYPLTHVDIKHPVGSETLLKQGQTISVEDMAYKMGQKIIKQKHRFVGLDDGPVSVENVGHIVDLCYVPNNEKAIVKQNLLKGARDMSSDAGIIFLNDK